MPPTSLRTCCSKFAPYTWTSSGGCCTSSLSSDAARPSQVAIDLYLYQRHALGHTPERITAALRRLLFDGLRGRPADAAP